MALSSDCHLLLNDMCMCQHKITIHHILIWFNWRHTTVFISMLSIPKFQAMKPLHESNLNELNTVIIAARDLICDKLYMWLKHINEWHNCMVALQKVLGCCVFFFADESGFSYRRPRSNANKIMTK